MHIIVEFCAQKFRFFSDLYKSFLPIENRLNKNKHKGSLLVLILEFICALTCYRSLLQ